jgi:hypothetical protein
MIGRIARNSLCIVTTSVCLCSSAVTANHDVADGVKVVVEKVERVSLNKVYFRLKLLNVLASPVFLDGRALLLLSEQPFAEQLFLDQWKDGEWHSIVPCLENAPSSIFRLNPGKTISQDRVLTDPVEAPCKDRHFLLDGTFRFRLEYFLSEEEAKTNERNFNAPGANLPAPQVAVSASFEIPPRNK